MLLARWGNSLAVRIPATVIKALNLHEGDDIEIHALDDKNLGVKKKPDRESFLKQLRKFRGTLPDDFIFDRAEVNERD
ncbi:MAG: AbrB/MazE/SpoVT family DNA-binding domain-containing protein [Burkholderiales bacterium]|jgi:antitoxin MazE|nr:AbrB/MazE/SpoVT family DNA-binding domain-containing protein [Burkholderiales bacterium]